MNDPNFDPQQPQQNPYMAEPVQPYQPQPSARPPWVEPVIHRITGKPIERLTRAKAILADQYWSMLGFCFLGLIVGSLLPFGILMGPVFCGLHICYAECRARRRPSFDHLVKGADYFGDSVIATLIMMGVSMLLTIPVFLLAVILFMVGMATVEQGGGALTVVLMFGAFVVYILGFVVSFLVYVPFIFVYPLIVDRKMTGVEAVKLSAKAAKQNFGPLSWFVFANMISSMLGALMCYIPAILLMPLNFASTFELYYEVFDWSEQKPLQENANTY